MRTIVRLGGERHQDQGPCAGVLDGVRNPGWNGESSRLSFRHRNVAHDAAFTDTNEGRADDYENFRSPFVIMIAANGARLGENYVNVALACQKRFVHRFDHPSARVVEKLNRLDRNLRIHVAESKTNAAGRQCLSLAEIFERLPGFRTAAVLSRSRFAYNAPEKQSRQ